MAVYNNARVCMQHKIPKRCVANIFLKYLPKMNPPLNKAVIKEILGTSHLLFEGEHSKETQ